MEFAFGRPAATKDKPKIRYPHHTVIKQPDLTRIEIGLSKTRVRLRMLRRAVSAERTAASTSWSPGRRSTRAAQRRSLPVLGSRLGL
jgi:hypothetical protein